MRFPQSSYLLFRFKGALAPETEKYNNFLIESLVDDAGSDAWYWVLMGLMRSYGFYWVLIMNTISSSYPKGVTGVLKGVVKIMLYGVPASIVS